MSSKKIARNTAALFGRQIAILLINLYSVRIFLKTLGIDDFALFNVIVNTVMIGSFLTASIGMITQRYFSFSLGKEDPSLAKSVHDASLIFCAASAFLALLGLETVGTWFVHNEMVIAADRRDAAALLFQLSIISFIVGNFSNFYASIILAHEDMHAFGLFSVVDAVLRLIAIFAIGLLGEGEKLTAYGALLSGISFVILIAYWLFCSLRYAECRLAPIRINLTTLHEMLGFAGWTVFGQVTGISRNQALTILINQSYNPATVAARALANSIATQVLTFSTNFSAALHPPIIKAHAAGEKAQMFRLIFTGSKITFYLVWVATLPALIVMPGILRLWLGHYPEETVIFTRLGLIENAIVAVSLPLMTAVRASGRMRRYELSLGALQLLIFALAVVSVMMGYPAYVIYVIAIIINIVMFAVRIDIVIDIMDLNIYKYTYEVIIPISLVVLCSMAVSLVLIKMVPEIEFISLSLVPILTTGIAVLVAPALIYTIGFRADERRSLHTMVRRMIAKLRGQS